MNHRFPLLLPLLFVLASMTATAQLTWQKTAAPPADFKALAVAPSGDVYISTIQAAFKSTDNGDSWVPILNNGNPLKASIIAVDVQGRVFFGNETGLLRSTDGGATWAAVGSGLNNHGFISLLTGFGGELLVLLDGGILQRSTDGGATFVTVNANLQGVTSLDMNSNGVMFLSNGSAALRRSTDGGANWVSVNSGLDGGVSRVGFNYAGTAFAASTQGIYRSTNNGDEWTKLSGVSSLPNISSFAMDVRDNIYAGSATEGAIMSSNNGDSWVAVNSGLTTTQVNMLGIYSNGYLYAATTAGIFRAGAPVLGVDDEPRLASRGTLRLDIDGPNPFSTGTALRVELAGDAHVRITLSDIAGRVMTTLHDGALPSGSHRIEAPAGDLSAGVYLCRVESGSENVVRRLVVVR